MNRELLKKIGIYIGIVLLFAALAYAFVPQVLQGKIVNQHDISGWKGMAQEANAYNKAHPEDPTAWTNSMFGGMPTTAIIDNFEGDWTKPLYKFLMLGKRPASYLFITLVGAFLLMLSMGTRKILAIAGAIAMTFCSYNMQIIQVGHNTKMQAIAFFPWVLAGVIFTYRAALGCRQNGCAKSCTDMQVADRISGDRTSWKTWLPKTVLGAVLFALALSMQIKANHIQITYYLAIVIFVLALSVFISLCVNKDRRHLLGRFFATSAILLVVGIIGIGTNANKLIPTYEYTPYTMRGGSELVSADENHNDKGLALDYATAWSYGIEEMPNLMIPNFNGGSSAGALDEDSATGQLLKQSGYRGRELKETLSQMPLYWGPQPFTAGPMYMGAITMFLFLLGMVVTRGSRKWWLFAAGVIAVFLSWGNHFMWFTKLWFEYVPFYNKFRTVSMALVVLQFTLPLLGFYALDKVLRQEVPQKTVMTGLGVAYGLTGFICLVFALVPGLAGSFEGSADSGLPALLAETLAQDRADLLRADALHSFVIISIAAALILWAVRTKSTAADSSRRYMAVAAAFCLIVLFDMWSVGKRYLNSDHFTTPSKFNAQYAQPRYADKYIKEDPALSYRVLDISENTFNSSLTSYHHQSIGGYSPVKLQRYQDLIDRYIAREAGQARQALKGAATVQDVADNLAYLPVVSMLNGKYIIIGGEYPAVENRYAMGNAWFADSVATAASPNEEIDLLGSVDLFTTAIIGKDFEDADVLSGVNDVLSGAAGTPDLIALTHYAPNELRYAFETSADRLAVFSEIYYPAGWKAWIEAAGVYGEVVDGHYRPTAEARPLDLLRANWILRAAVLPEGEGTIVMRFEPESYPVGANISRACSITLILLLLLSVGGLFVPRQLAACLVLK